ncbi:hypothetical protein B0T14DRAFT_563971 [Immersiella caudata]|uniref:Uncharacterized protein n=1 Tax=Immersiella caudata TaxID=314043 RepID=A0AA40C323_9PEZI|nr:hypothetical protein B0T14DRAFT_563971 [Immersiella caudata]
MQADPVEYQALLLSPEQQSPPAPREKRQSTFAPGQREADDVHFQRSGVGPREAISAHRNDNLLGSGSLGLDPMDFSLSDMAFDANDLNLMMQDNYSARIEQREDDTTLCGPASGTNKGWNSHGKQPEPCVGTERDTMNYEAASADMTSGCVNMKRLTGSYKDLLKLSLELVEDREILDTQAPLTARPSIAPLTCSSTQQQRPVNRVLSQTARFWDIVKAMSTSSPETCPNTGSCSSTSGFVIVGHSGQTRSGSTSSSVSLINLGGIDHSWENASMNGNGDLDSNLSASSTSSLPSSTPGRQDHLLIINLVMTYVNLLRNCRAVFARLYQALQVTPSPESNAMLILPSLQFGEFQLDNNVPIQVKVLIELTSGMLQRIGSAFGINAATGTGVPLSPDDHNYRLPFLNEPFAVSVRETILSQESMQGGVYGSEPPLVDIMSNLKRLLERR